MKPIRWSGEDDHYFGPLTYCRDKFNNMAIVLGSGDGEEYAGCRLRASGFGHTFVLALPAVIRPWRKKIVVPEWSVNGTADRLGRDWYWQHEEREYGFSYGCDTGGIGGGGFLQVFYGYEINGGPTHQRWSCFTPWNNWRHVRHSFYGLDGNHFWTASDESNRLMGSEDWQVRRDAEDACPSRTFSFTDFDGEQLTAKTRIEEREWHFGTGWFKWLAWFRKPLIRRSLDIDFSGETGKKKGSWKGGTTGHSIDMLPGELHEAAFRRYCDEHDMKFSGDCN
jgi:hypothetical protein